LGNEAQTKEDKRQINHNKLGGLVGRKILKIA